MVAKVMKGQIWSGTISKKFMSPEVYYLCGQGWYYATLLLIGMHWQVVLDCMHMHADAQMLLLWNIHQQSNKSKPTLNSHMVYWPDKAYISFK